MAKKVLNRLGIKTRKQKIEDEKARQRRLEDLERDNAYGVTRTRKGAVKENIDGSKTQETTTITPGERQVGQFKSMKAKTGVSSLGNTYKDGSEFKDTKDTSDQMSKREKRIANRQFAKEGRKNRRAEKVAERKGMSNQQAKDFMQNRRDRFKQMGTNFVKGLAGLPMDTKVDQRLMRKGGYGTLQNTIGEDGKVYDATSPYKGSAAKGFSDRGGTRDKTDITQKYLDELQPKRKLDITPIKIPNNIITTNKNKKDKPQPEVDPIKNLVDPDDDSPTDYTNYLIKDNVRTKYNANFYDNQETIPGFGEGDSKGLKNLNLDNMDRKGITTAMDEITMNKALSSSGNVSFNDNFAGKYGNVGGMKKSNYDINLLNPSGGIKPFKPLRNAIKNSNFFNKNSKKKN